jgi:hypothetical protein
MVVRTCAFIYLFPSGATPLADTAALLSSERKGSRQNGGYANQQMTNELATMQSEQIVSATMLEKAR